MEFSPEPALLRHETYSVESIGIGIGGFFVSIPNIDLPLFLKGELEEYRFFNTDDSAYVLILHINRAVYLLDTWRQLCSRVYGHFNNCCIEAGEILLTDSDYPILNETPDRVRFSNERGLLERDLGHVITTPEYHGVQFEPLLKTSV